ncbi:hypothetical protein QRO11_09685 [Paracidovorax citrulli]|uniref:hypothetical protein n=1 Tax=Paracidovorax citrulli TaxID=80869 RepID=UPI001D1818B0|nr:hypothetical protein [Paracidovorax citrulli]UEG48048.1 hypothetical protein LKW27_09445 [Paracidovorax citrulli]WIY36562.1 hypothetical protein QRO11_09685 [Paracidovorax citrulli]
MTRPAAMIRRCSRGALPPAGTRRMRGRAFALWMWLAAALVFSPALGRLHQVVHGPVATMVLQGASAGAAVAGGASIAGTEAGAASGAGLDPLSHGHEAGLLQALFSHHADSDCHLLDQSIFGAALLPALLPVAMPVVSPAPDDLPATGVGARPQRAFLARAPPHSRAA